MTFDIHYLNEKKRIDLAELESLHVEEIDRINTVYNRKVEEMKQQWAGFGRSGSPVFTKQYGELERERQNEFDRLKRTVERKREIINLEFSKNHHENNLRLENERFKAALHKLNSEGQAQQALRPAAEIPVTMPDTEAGETSGKLKKKLSPQQRLSLKIDGIIRKHLKKNIQATYNDMHGDIVKAKNGSRKPGKKACQNRISKIRREMNLQKPIR